MGQKEGESGAKDYHVCDTSEQFYDFDRIEEGESNHDSIEEAKNMLEEGDNKGERDTLLLDSHSIIIEGGNEAPLLNSFDASSIIARDSVPLQGPPSQSNNSNGDDVLTYSLTNTYSTIESLHDELAAIKQSLEQSQRRGAPALRAIHEYAKEIETNSREEEEEKWSENGSGQNVQFKEEIKFFYSRIHQEIGALKKILGEPKKQKQ